MSHSCHSRICGGTSRRFAEDPSDRCIRSRWDQLRSRSGLRGGAPIEAVLRAGTLRRVGCGFGAGSCCSVCRVGVKAAGEEKSDACLGSCRDLLQLLSRLTGPAGRLEEAPGPEDLPRFSESPLILKTVRLIAWPRVVHSCIIYDTRGW